MDTVILVIGFAVLGITLLSAADLYFGLSRMVRLVTLPMGRSRQHRVSLIVPACNEEQNIEHALLSLLEQEYENIEIIAVNDRSTDNTGKILERLKATYTQLKVVHVEQLPPEWMGKTHAMHVGAQKATGDFLLFTDGDIVMEKTTIARSINYMVGEHLDHLTLLFKNSSPGIVLNSLILESGAGLIQLLRPWLARKKRSVFVGVGAFNLVKRSAYYQIDGHEKIKMHPIDDIMLGKRIKKVGLKQECLLGHDLVTVPWYATVSDMISGLMKNVLAIINYRFSLVPLLLFGIFFLNILPLWGVILFKGWPQYLFSAVICIKLLAFYSGTRLLGLSPWCVPGTLITPYIIVYILLRATWLNRRDNGIFWRGTHYSLDELRKNEPLFF